MAPPAPALEEFVESSSVSKMKNKDITNEQHQQSFFDIEESEIIEQELEKDFKVTHDGGVIKRILERGQGEKPQQGDEVMVNYTGRTVAVDDVPKEDKPVFDSNQDKVNPFKFTLGKGMVIQGWEKGIATMRKGERSTFTLKPDYAYGAAGAGANIPPNSTLEFEVMLLDFKSMNDLTPDGKVKFKMVSKSAEGKSWEKPKDGYEVLISYKEIHDNKTVASEQEEFKFIVGQISSLPSPYFNDAVKKMMRGDVAKLIIDSSLADDKQIVADCNLIFEIKLLDYSVIQRFEDNLIQKKTIKEGEGWDHPKDCASVQISLKAYSLPSEIPILNEINAYSPESSIIIGHGVLPEGLELVMAELKKGEKAEIIAPKSLFYGKTKMADFAANLEMEDQILYQIELVDFTNPKESWDLTFEEKLQDAEEARLVGNNLFKEDLVRLAVKKYTKATGYFEFESKSDGEEKAKVDAILLPCHLNLSACYLKNQEYLKVIESCGKALSIDPSSVKALYRRAQAKYYRHDFESAMKDCEKCLSIDSNETAVKSLMKQIHSRLKEQDEKDKKFYSKMFQ